MLEDANFMTKTILAKQQGMMELPFSQARGSGEKTLKISKLENAE